MQLIPIGIIHSPYKTRMDAPRQGRLADDEAVLEIHEEFKDGLMYVERLKHLIVLYWCHKAERDVLQTVTPWGPELKGVFATRSPARPNPIAFCIAEVIRMDGNRIYVKGVDALDGSPLLDIKPYSYQIDSVEGLKDE
jgi:tRNA-Thr(GGU) m(6)t(6)A37 methyltransferase TsaA